MTTRLEDALRALDESPLNFPRFEFHELAEAVRAHLATPQADEAKREAEVLEILKERDDRQHVIDEILTRVLGYDRPEWSSGYGYRDAIEEVEDRMAELTKPATPQAAQVPEGYALVPVEPTEAMLDVMHECVRILCNPAKKSASIRNDREVWAAMLAAAQAQGVGRG